MSATRFSNLNTLLLIGLIGLSAVFNSDRAVAQDETKALVAECIKAQREAFGPLQERNQQMFRVYSSRSGAIYEVIRWLEQDPETAEEKRLQEIASAEARLESLKSLGDMTTGDAIKPENVSKTIEDANVKIEDIGDERATAARPLDRERAALQRKFKPQEDKLEPALEALIREKGSGELTAELERSYTSFMYSTAQVSGQYKRAGKSLACTVRIYLVSPRKAKPDLGMVAEKYPLVSKSDNQLEFLVGPCMVNIYSSDRALNKEKLGEVVQELIDLEKLESLVK